MFSIDKVREIVCDICKKAECEVNVPIEINSRLRTTLGRVMLNSWEDGTAYPTRIEFSKKMLESEDDGLIIGTIYHETAHYIATTRTNENHGHDTYFKKICEEINCPTESRKSFVNISGSIESKYVINCPKCGEVARFQRKGKIIKNLKICKCAKCGSGGLELIQNY